MLLLNFFLFSNPGICLVFQQEPCYNVLNFTTAVVLEKVGGDTSPRFPAW